jgi:site-specific DNA-methyltransferase (adenine-specific)
VLRDLTERVIIASKGRFDRPLSTDVRARAGLPHESTIFRDEFMDATLDLWEIPPESATRVGHPAPFPVALPERLIHLYTYRGDLVLDPFMGSGTTAVAALRAERHFVGYDTDADYVALATQRVADERARLAGRPQQERSLPVVSSAAVPPDGDESFHARAVRDGLAAKELCRTLLKEAGFAEPETGVKVHGVEVTFSVRDVSGRRLLVDCSGAFTSSRPGLQRTDTLWKALGKASVLSSLAERDEDGDAEVDLVLVSTDLPTPRSTGGRALSAVLEDATNLLVEVLSMNDDGLTALAALAKGVRPGDADWPGTGWRR